MKKLTAGIFSVLMGLVAVNAADAAVASKGYVTGQINAVNEEIAKKVSQETYDAYTAANDTAVASKVAQTVYDAKVQALDSKDAELAADIAKRTVLSVAGDGLKLTEGVLTLDGIATADGLSNLTTTVEGHTTALGTLNGGAEVTGSVAQQIAAATTAITTAYEAADTGLQNQINALDGTYATDTELANEKAALQQQITANANNFANYTTTADMNTALGLKEDVANKVNNSTDVTNSGKQKSELYPTLSYTETLITQNTNDAYRNIGDMEALEEATGKTDLSAAVVQNKTAIDNLNGTYVSEEEMTAFKSQNTQAIADAKSGAETTAATYTDNSIAALALQAISRVPAECSEQTKYCALTTNGTNFVWEVIERDPSEFEADGITLKSDGRTVVQGVTE